MFQQKSTCLKMITALLQNPKGLHCNPSTGVFQRLQRAFPPTSDTSSMTGSAGSMAQMVQQPGPAAEPFLILHPTKY